MDRWCAIHAQIDLRPKEGVQWSSVTVKVCIIIVLYLPQNKKYRSGEGYRYHNVLHILLFGHSKS